MGKKFLAWPMMLRMSRAGRKPHSFLVTLCSLVRVNTPCANTGKHTFQKQTQHPSHFKMKPETTCPGDLQLLSQWTQGGAKIWVEHPGETRREAHGWGPAPPPSQEEAPKGFEFSQMTGGLREETTKCGGTAASSRVPSQRKPPCLANITSVYEKTQRPRPKASSDTR